MITIDDVKSEFKIERENGLVKILLFIDDTKLVSKTIFREGHYQDNESSIEDVKKRMLKEYGDALSKKYFDYNRAFFIGESMHKFPCKSTLWWDADEFYVVTENPLVGSARAERLNEKQALAWTRAYLSIDSLGKRGIKIA